MGSSVNPNKKEQQCENCKPDIMALKLLKILIGVNKYYTSIFSFNIKKKTRRDHGIDLLKINSNFPHERMNCFMLNYQVNKILISDSDFFQNIPGTQKLGRGSFQDLLTILQPRI